MVVAQESTGEDRDVVLLVVDACDVDVGVDVVRKVLVADLDE